jgi:hypothetical protein
MLVTSTRRVLPVLDLILDGRVFEFMDLFVPGVNRSLAVIRNAEHQQFLPNVEPVFNGFSGGLRREFGERLPASAT